MRHYILIAVLLCGSLGRLTAAPAEFVIDTAQSQVTLAGEVLGSTVQEQAPGSLTSRFQGVIKAEVTGSTIRFTGGSVIDAITNGVWEPNVGGAAGAAAADFGGKASSLFVTVKGAFRNIVLDVQSEVIPVAGGSFDASALTFAFPENSTAALDYDLVLMKDRLVLTGLATNDVTSAGMLVTENGVQKLIIQVDTDYRFTALQENDSRARFTGQIVATRASLPLISTISIVDDKLSVTVEGASPAAQLQSSTDLTAWQAHAAERVTAGNTTTFTAEPSAPIEFFRVVQ